MRRVELRMPSELYAEIEARARQERRSVNQQVLRMLEEKLSESPPSEETGDAVRKS